MDPRRAQEPAGAQGTGGARPPVDPAAPVRAGARRLRLLVVDDRATNRRVVRGILAARGYEVLEARSGEEAVALAWQAAPDLILMDIQMPGMDGVEATRRIREGVCPPGRAAGAGRDVPIVAVTAYVAGEARQRYLRAGMSAVLPKPFGVEQLCELVERLLGRVDVGRAPTPPPRRTRCA